jgi:hypothetical protein
VTVDGKKVETEKQRVLQDSLQHACQPAA